MKKELEEARSRGKLLEVELGREEIERRRFSLNLDGKEVKVNLLGQGLEDGDVVQVGEYLVVIRQREEEVVAIPLEDPVLEFKAGFVVGNLHLRAMQVDKVVYVSASEYGVPFLLERLKELNPRVERVKFRPNLEAFQVVVNVEPKGATAV